MPISLSKINLFLKITGKRENGYHEIDTVFLPIENPSDEITISYESEGGIKISSSTDIIPCNESNLCWKAADLYFKKAAIKESCNIHIEKLIPVAAGMGGGSSNAATVLNLLNDKFNALSSSELSVIALSLGADVPFFLKPKLSKATGIGEELVPVDFDYPEIPLVIVAPNFPVSAAWAYKNSILAQDCNRKGEMQEVLEAVKTGNYQKLSTLVRNDLAIPLYNKFPLLSFLKEKMLDHGALCSEVTGSGPTMFAICESPLKAASLAKKLRSELPDSMNIWSV